MEIDKCTTQTLEKKKHPGKMPGRKDSHKKGKRKQLVVGLGFD